MRRSDAGEMALKPGLAEWKDFGGRRGEKERGCAWALGAAQGKEHSAVRRPRAANSATVARSLQLLESHFFHLKKEGDPTCTYFTDRADAR